MTDGMHVDKWIHTSTNQRRGAVALQHTYYIDGENTFLKHRGTVNIWWHEFVEGLKASIDLATTGHEVQDVDVGSSGGSGSVGRMLEE